MKRKLVGLLLLITVSLTLTSCLKTTQPTKEIRVWWGSKEEVKIFLDKPEAKAERWLVQALGE